MYDWANSAFQTTVLTVLAGPYLTQLAQRDVGTNGVVLSFWPIGSITALALYPYCLAISEFFQVILLPLLGAIADRRRAKKRLMMVFCYGGVASSCLLSVVSGRQYLFGGLVLIVANFAFGVTIVLYNAFLNDITTKDRRDKVSSQGYALGYLGGGLLLAANLALITASPRLGISKDVAVRLSLLSAGLWWGGFALITFARLRTRGSTRTLVHQSDLAIARLELRALWTELRRLPQTRRYLVAYMAFNDAIQTVIAVASIFLAQELFVARALPIINEAFLMGLVLMVQFVAFGGALLFERVAVFLTTKNTILVSLLIWTGIVVYAYGFLQNVRQAWIMGAILAVVLGGSQALSRSLFSQMIPVGHEAAFFGVYEITERGTSWIGPFVFGVVASVTSSYRKAILSLVVLFVAGLVMLFFTDTDRAIRDASHHVETDHRMTSRT